MTGDKPDLKPVYDRIVKALGKPRVDYVLISHFHQDHVGSPALAACDRRVKATGLFALFDQLYGPFSATSLLDPGDDDEDYIPDRSAAHCGVIQKYRGWESNHRISERRTPQLGTHDINLGGPVMLDVVAVSGRVSPTDPGLMTTLANSPHSPYADDSPASENDRSIAFFLRFGDFEFFSGGDLTGSPPHREDHEYEVRPFGAGKRQIYTNVESHMVRYWRENHRETVVEVYRANHHGSEYSSNRDLARALQPQVVVYSSGAENTYGHPKPEIVSEFCHPDGARAALHQYVTTGVASNSWDDGGLPKECGTVVDGDVTIYVWNGGANYSVNSDTYEALTDALEAQQVRDAGGPIEDDGHQ